MTGAGEPRPHVLGDLGIAVHEDGDVLRSDLPVVGHMGVDATASLRPSVLATWADSLLGLAAIRHIAPGLAVTLELEVDLFVDIPTRGTLRAAASVVKAGRAVIVTSMEVTDERGRSVALGQATFMAAPDPKLTMPEGSWALDRFTSRRGVLGEPFALAAGCRRREPGVAAIECAPHVMNSGMTLNGGFLALGVEEAVLSAAPGASIGSMSLRFLRPVRQGPAVARARLYGGVGVVDVRDAGSDTLAVTATTRPRVGSG